MVTSNDPVGQQMNNRPSDVPSPSDGGPSPLRTFIISAIIVVGCFFTLLNSLQV